MRDNKHTQELIQKLRIQGLTSTHYENWDETKKVHLGNNNIDSFRPTPGGTIIPDTLTTSFLTHFQQLLSRV